MYKNVLRIITILMIILTVISISISSFALQPNELVGKNNATGTTEITQVGNSLIGILQVVGIVLSVVILIVIGIKYMMGSAEEKAEYKKTMMPYVIGAALVFAASAIAGILYSFLSNVSAS